MVDLEQHRIVELLPDREAQTLVDWLEEHPGVEIFSRDRSKTYKSAMSEGAPNAIQVADRFHLLDNLQEVLENVFHSHCPVLKSVDETLLKQRFPEPLAPKSVSKTKSAREEQKAQSRARRLEQYEQIHALKKQGFLIIDIAHQLNINRHTVSKYLAAPVFPERQTRTQLAETVIDPYKAYLYQEWMAGRHNAQQLFEEIQQQGFKGCYGTVVYYLRKLHPFSPRNPSKPKARPPREPSNRVSEKGSKDKITEPKPLTPRNASWLVMRHLDQLTEEEEDTLVLLSGQPELSDAITLTQSFLFLVRKRLPQHLDNWLELAKNSSFKPFQTFAKGLSDDYEAVKAGLTLEVSNGPVEGFNNKLKMIKRQMYGRAGLDLLNKRLVLAS